MPRARTNKQRQIYELLGQADDGLLTPEQYAAQQAAIALIKLTRMAESIWFGDKSLADELRRFGPEQIIDDDRQWSQVKVDWKTVENRIGDATAALFVVSQMRRWNLNNMARERAAINAEKRQRNGR